MTVPILGGECVPKDIDLLCCVRSGRGLRSRGRHCWVPARRRRADVPPCYPACWESPSGWTTVLLVFASLGPTDWPVPQAPGCNCLGLWLQYGPSGVGVLLRCLSRSGHRPQEVARASAARQAPGIQDWGAKVGRGGGRYMSDQVHPTLTNRLVKSELETKFCHSSHTTTDRKLVRALFLSECLFSFVPRWPVHMICSPHRPPSPRALGGSPPVPRYAS